MIVTVGRKRRLGFLLGVEDFFFKGKIGCLELKNLKCPTVVAQLSSLGDSWPVGVDERTVNAIMNHCKTGYGNQLKKALGTGFSTGSRKPRSMTSP